MSGAAPRRAALLVAAAGAAWEPAWLEALARPTAGPALARRCLDLAELLATAATGVADLAVVSGDLPGLDADSVQRLARSGVRTVAVAGRDGAGDLERLGRLGVDLAVTPAGPEELLAAVARLVERPRDPGGAPRGADPVAEAEALLALPADGEPRDGSVVAVCGPFGSHGRTTVAVGLAAEAARRGRAAAVLDVDPHGGAAGLHLAVLDEVSGVLAAARAANAGELTPAALARLARDVAPGVRLLTGLPRPDRWREVRPQALATLLEVARALDDVVVVDGGPGAPETALDPFPGAPAREELTATTLEAADVLVAVGAADPVGLTRLVRALPALVETAPHAPLHVVVNRMRPSVGWSRADVVELVAAVAPHARVAFLPDDVAAADRALVAGRTLPEGRDSALRKAVGALASAVLADVAAGHRVPVRR